MPKKLHAIPQDVGHRGFYSIDEILQRLPVSKATLYRRIQAKEFPPSVKISRGRVAWPKDLVDAHFEKLENAAA
jgi:predicted DNA-binding transcriptional regulator AlpA